MKELPVYQIKKHQSRESCMAGEIPPLLQLSNSANCSMGICMCTWCPSSHCCHWKLRAQIWLDIVFCCPPETFKGLWDTHMGLRDATLDLQESHALLERQLDAGWGLGASQAALDVSVCVVNQALISAVNGSLESCYTHLKADAYSYVGLQSGIWNLDVFICSCCLAHHD